MSDELSAEQRRAALGLALRHLRERSGLTQKQLGESSGADDTYISRVEHGRIDVGWSTLGRLLDALGTDLHGLADAVAVAERQSSGRKR